MREVAVLGVGMHAFGKFPEKSVTELCRDAVTAAIADAGINWRDIEAVSAYVSNMRVTSPEQVIVGGDAANGAALYVLCQQCHGAAGEGNQVMNSPGLTGISDWYLVDGLSKFKQGIRGANPANPNAVMMRGMSNSLADDQAIKDVVAHIMTLQQAN